MSDQNSFSWQAKCHFISYALFLDLKHGERGNVEKYSDRLVLPLLFSVGQSYAISVSGRHANRCGDAILTDGRMRFPSVVKSIVIGQSSNQMIGVISR